MTPCIQEEVRNRQNGKDHMLDELVCVAHDVAMKMNVPVIDVRKAFQTAEQVANQENVYKGVFTIDGIHLNSKGMQILAGILATRIRVIP